MCPNLIGNSRHRQYPLTNPLVAVLSVDSLDMDNVPSRVLNTVELESLSDPVSPTYGSRNLAPIYRAEDEFQPVVPNPKLLFQLKCATAFFTRT